MFFMRASDKGERAFCLLFWLQEKNAGSVFEHARIARGSCVMKPPPMNNQIITIYYWFLKARNGKYNLI